MATSWNTFRDTLASIKMMLPFFLTASYHFFLNFKIVAYETHILLHIITQKYFKLRYKHEIWYLYSKKLVLNEKITGHLKNSIWRLKSKMAATSKKTHLCVHILVTKTFWLLFKMSNYSNLIIHFIFILQILSPYNLILVIFNKIQDGRYVKHVSENSTTSNERRFTILVSNYMFSWVRNWIITF